MKLTAACKESSKCNHLSSNYVLINLQRAPSGSAVSRLSLIVSNITTNWKLRRRASPPESKTVDCKSISVFLALIKTRLACWIFLLLFLPLGFVFVSVSVTFGRGSAQVGSGLVQKSRFCPWCALLWPASVLLCGPTRPASPAGCQVDTFPLRDDQRCSWLLALSLSVQEGLIRLDQT